MAIVKMSWSSGGQSGDLLPDGTVKPSTFLNVKLVKDLKKDNYSLQVLPVSLIRFTGLETCKAYYSSFIHKAHTANIFPGYNASFFKGILDGGQLRNFSSLSMQQVRGLYIAERPVRDFIFKLKADGSIWVPLRNSGILFQIHLLDNHTLVRCQGKSQEKLDKLLADGNIYKNEVTQTCDLLANVYRLYAQACSLVTDPSQGGARVSTEVTQ